MVSDLKIFVLKLSKIAAQKNVFFVVADFALQNMVEATLPNGLRPLVEGRIANFGIFLDVFEFLHFGLFFLFFKKIGFWGILCPTKHGGNHASRWIRHLWSKGISLNLFLAVSEFLCFW